MKKTMTTEDFAARVGIHPKTAEIWARTGRVRATKVGRVWRIDAREADPDKRARIPISDFAARVGVCYRTAVRWAVAGKIDAVQRVPNGQWLVAAREVGRQAARTAGEGSPDPGTGSTAGLRVKGEKSLA
jgi:excisionase family DNA binding protein